MLHRFGLRQVDLDDMTTIQIGNAWGMTEVLRREQIQDAAISCRMAQADPREWKQMMQQLETDEGF